MDRRSRSYPFRYLFNGKTIRIESSNNKHLVHHIASFHKDGLNNYFKTKENLHSSSKGMLKTVEAIILLVPGLLLAVSKGSFNCFSQSKRCIQKHL